MIANNKGRKCNLNVLLCLLAVLPYWFHAASKGKIGLEGNTLVCKNVLFSV